MESFRARYDVGNCPHSRNIVLKQMDNFIAGNQKRQTFQVCLFIIGENRFSSNCNFERKSNKALVYSSPSPWDRIQKHCGYDTGGRPWHSGGISGISSLEMMESICSNWQISSAVHRWRTRSATTSR